MARVAWNKGKKGVMPIPWNKGTKGVSKGHWKGKKLSDAHRKKLSDSHKGYVTPESQRKKQSESMKGKNTWMTGKKASLETRRKVSESHKGEKSYLWKGGITPINQKIRHSFEYKLWRDAVFKRDNYTCIWCGSKGRIEADHIKQFAYYPELRFAIDNGRTLCRPCHETTDTYRSRGKK